MHTLSLNPGYRSFEPDGPWIKCRWGERISVPVQNCPGVHLASLPGVKWPGHGVNHSPPSSAEVKEKVELYLYSHSGSSWPVIVWIMPEF
jgi:hypothetical protein